jgi:excisionase family DNA binding protein
MATRENIVKGVKAPAASVRDGLPVRGRSKEVQHVDRRSARTNGQIRRAEIRQAEVQNGQIASLLHEPLLNADEAAELLHVPRSTVYELARSRRLPHVRLGRSLRFTREQLARWVEENTFR